MKANGKEREERKREGNQPDQEMKGTDNEIRPTSQRKREKEREERKEEGKQPDQETKRKKMKRNCKGKKIKKTKN